MKNEWDFFADVQQQLAAGAQLVTYYSVERLVFPPDAQGGRVLDEQGNEYELGADYTQALNECIRAKHISWGICFQERTICFGPGVNEIYKGEKATFSFGPDDDVAIEAL